MNAEVGTDSAHSNLTASLFSGRAEGALCEIPNPKCPPDSSELEILPSAGISHSVRVSHRAPRVWLLLFCFALCGHHSGSIAYAVPTQEDVFKSISNNVDDKIDGRKVLGFFAAAAGLVILLVLINKREQREDLPKVTNHQGKLLRELMKATGLKSSQIRQLKMLSADLSDKGQPVKNLTTLLLCPSLIKKAREPRPPDQPRG